MKHESGAGGGVLQMGLLSVSGQLGSIAMQGTVFQMNDEQLLTLIQVQAFFFTEQ
jgi:hypothetical protein